MTLTSTRSAMNPLHGPAPDSSQRPWPGWLRLPPLGRTRPFRRSTKRCARTSAWVRPLRQEIGRVIVGQKNLVDRLLVGLVTNGHVLLEGVPGSGQDAVAQDARRGHRSLKFQRHPVHAGHAAGGHRRHDDLQSARRQLPHQARSRFSANFILADEINRAPAKVQSALLEAMQERQVTLGDETYELPEPFLVLATQNPLEQEGTYPLPEAQVDRFMLKVIVDYPNRPRNAPFSTRWPPANRISACSRWFPARTSCAARRVVNSVYVDDKIKDYIVDIVLATRDPKRYGIDLNGYVRYGASPRATIAAHAGRAGLGVPARAAVTSRRRT